MPEPANFSVIETLRNGRKVEIRSQRPQDGEELEAAVARMSDESLYRRFFAAKHRFSEAEAGYFLNIDFATHAALVVVANESGKDVIVGAGRYIVVRPGQAELAFAIIDNYQRQGIGAALVRNLAAIARQAGLTELIAEVLASNGAVLKIFERSGLHMSTRRDGPVVHVRLTYAPQQKPK
ncbi:MAG: GNAT family N-acetyltransferase [Pseudomonadota bacterium]